MNDNPIDDIRVENPDGRTAPVRIHIDPDLFSVSVGAIHVTRATAEKIRDELIAALPLAPSEVYAWVRRINEARAREGQS